MQQMRTKALIVAFTVLLYSCGSGTGNVILVNNAREQIAYVVVVVCRQTIEARSVKPGERKAAGSFKINCEGDFDVNVELASGKRLHANFGYVTSGLDMSSEISITDAEITLGATNANLR
jgi:hypothetical protein